MQVVFSKPTTAKKLGIVDLFFVHANSITVCEFENAVYFHRSSVGMLSLKKDKKEEEEKDGGNPYTHLEKTSVLQEARYGL